MEGEVLYTDTRLSALLQEIWVQNVGYGFFWLQGNTLLNLSLAVSYLFMLRNIFREQFNYY